MNFLHLATNRAVMDTKKFVLTAFCALVSIFLVAQNTIVEAEYYIGEDPGFGNATPIDISSGADISEDFTASLDDIDPGFQFAYVRVKDENDVWSIPVKVPFRVAKTEIDEVVYAESYLNTDPGFGNAEEIDIDQGETVEDQFSSSTELLDPGRHDVYIRVQDSEGNWSIPARRSFIVNDELPLDVVAAEYFIDEDPGIGSATPTDVTNPDHFIEEMFSTIVPNDLPFGDHFLFLRVQNEELTWSIRGVRPFTVGNLSTEDNELISTTEVFPIPSSDFVNVKNDFHTITGVRLIDMSGKTVDGLIMDGGKIDLRHLSKGVYLLRVDTEAGAVNRKIILE